MELDLRRFLGLVLLPGLIVAGCAGGADRYPSLAIRDFERPPVDEASSAALAPQPVPTAIQERIALAASAANDAHDAFLSASPRVEKIIQAAAGTGPEDNVWSEAQVALAELDSKRGTTAIALGDLDQLYSNATLDFTERDGIADARDKVAMLIAMEDQALERLRSQLDR